MRIAIVNQHVEDVLGGSEIQCDIIGRELGALGHDIVYVAPYGRADYSGAPYRVIALPDADPEAIARSCVSQQPDLVYWRFNKRSFRRAATLIRSGAGIPMVFAVSHINDVQPWATKPESRGNFRLPSLKRRLIARWNHEGFRHVDALTTLNRDFLELSPVEHRAHIPNSMSSEAVPFDWPRPYIAWVANVKAAKRPELCIELANRIPDIDVLMVGAIQQPSYAWMSDPARFPPNLHYLGPKPLDEASGIIAGARCLVHTCQPEGFGNNFIQAWLQGTPVVSYEFDPGGLLKGQGLGLCSGGDFQRFVEDVRGLLRDTDTAQALARTASAYADEHFRASANVRKLEAFLQDVLERRRTASAS